MTRKCTIRLLNETCDQQSQWNNTIDMNDLNIKKKKNFLKIRNKTTDLNARLRLQAKLKLQSSGALVVIS